MKGLDMLCDHCFSSSRVLSGTYVACGRRRHFGEIVSLPESLLCTSVSHELIWKARRRGHTKALSHCFEMYMQMGEDNRRSPLVESLGTSMGNACFGDQGIGCGLRRRLFSAHCVSEKFMDTQRSVRDLGDKGLAESQGQSWISK